MGNFLSNKKQNSLERYIYIKLISNNFIVVTEKNGDIFYYVCDLNFKKLYRFNIYSTKIPFNIHIFGNNNELIIVEDYLYRCYTMIDNEYNYTNSTKYILDLVKLDGIYFSSLPLDKNDIEIYEKKSINILSKYYLLIKKGELKYATCFIDFPDIVDRYDYILIENEIFILLGNRLYKINDNKIYSLDIYNIDAIGLYCFHYIVIYDEFGNTKAIDRSEVNNPTKIEYNPRIIEI